MDSSAPLSLKADLALWPLLAFGALAGVMVFAVMMARRSSQSTQALAKLVAVIAALVFGMLVVVGFFVSSVGVSVSRTGTRPRVELERQELKSMNLPSPRVESANNDSQTQVAAELENAPPNGELPEWTQQPSRVDGANTFVVVKSGRFASLEEAELHALDEAGQAAARHFRHLDPNGVGQCVPIQRELVRESAIRDRFEEISRHDLGTMKNFPMHQVWLRLELSPQLGEKIAEPWRHAAVAARLRTLTGWSVWGTAAAALIAFALRLDSAWNGRRRAIVMGTTVALMLGSLVFLA